MIDGLLRLADRCGEALASANEPAEPDAVCVEQMKSNLEDINHEVWRIRWEIGLFGGHTKPAPTVGENEAQATGPAESEGGAA